MRTMNRSIALLIICALAAAAPGLAQAQIPPGASPLSPPPLPAPPPPKIEVPVVPQMDAAPQRPSAQVGRKSFHDRVVDCLDEGAAAGLGPNQRATYSRACANR